MSNGRIYSKEQLKLAIGHFDSDCKLRTELVATRKVLVEKYKPIKLVAIICDISKIMFDDDETYSKCLEMLNEKKKRYDMVRTRKVLIEKVGHILRMDNKEWADFVVKL